jgi:hypothetical protein
LRTESAGFSQDVDRLRDLGCAQRVERVARLCISGNTRAENEGREARQKSFHDSDACWVYHYVILSEAMDDIISEVSP